jgi:hypothetical protein
MVQKPASTLPLTTWLSTADEAKLTPSRAGSRRRPHRHGARGSRRPEAQQHGHDAQRADDDHQRFHAHDVGHVGQRADGAQRGASLHQAAEDQVLAGACEGLLDEQIGAAGGAQCEQAARMNAHPGAVWPQVLIAKAEELDREQGGAGYQQRKLAEQRLAQRRPLRKAVQQQAQTQAGQHALQHLFVERADMEAGRA